MTFIVRRLLGETDDDAANRQSASLAALAFALALVVAGLFLVHRLKAEAKVEDCLLAGRMNCDAVLASVSR
jgi:hypothetical protein